MKALIVVDVQNDFLPGGSLAVPSGDEIIPVINRLILKANVKGWPVFFTKDTHPPEHISFASRHGMEPYSVTAGGKRLWPDHCVIGTEGWELANHLTSADLGLNIEKGTNPDFDSYSGFADDGGVSTPLADHIDEIALSRDLDAERPGTELIICGLALDYCVSFTACDARRLLYDTTVVLDGCRPVAAESAAGAVFDMAKAGVKLVASSALL